MCGRYVEVEAGDLSLMLRKSVEARDFHLWIRSKRYGSGTLPASANLANGFFSPFPTRKLMKAFLRYVEVEAGDLSLMLRKSVEARDWLATLEPRTVRAVMKRVIEDVTLIGGNQSS